MLVVESGRFEGLCRYHHLANDNGFSESIDFRSAPLCTVGDHGRGAASTSKTENSELVPVGDNNSEVAGLEIFGLWTIPPEVSLRQTK